MKSINRPWQSIVLLIIYAFNILTMVMGLFLASSLFNIGTIEPEDKEDRYSFIEGAELTDEQKAYIDEGYEEAAINLRENSLFSTILQILKIISIITIVITLIIMWGIYNGKKWAAITSIVLSVLALLSLLLLIFEEFNSETFISLAIVIFIIYLAYECFKSPFFRSNNETQSLDTNT